MFRMCVLLLVVTLTIRTQMMLGSRTQMAELKIIKYWSNLLYVWLPLWFVAGRDDIMSHYGLPVVDDVHMAALSVAVTIYVNPVS